jgi:hypothetical protein
MNTKWMQAQSDRTQRYVLKTLDLYLVKWSEITGQPLRVEWAGLVKYRDEIENEPIPSTYFALAEYLCMVGMHVLERKIRRAHRIARRLGTMWIDGIHLRIY